MLGAVDALKRPLTIPARFVPYMEKHRIYELFHELATELVIKKPLDHIVYLKQCLHHASRKRDVPRIILLAPSEFDKLQLAQCLQNELGVRPVTLNDIREVYKSKIDGKCENADDIAISMRKILRTGMIHDSGWVLVGFLLHQLGLLKSLFHEDVPRTRIEALALQRVGVIPTHVIEIIDPMLEYQELSDAVNNFHPPLKSQYERFKSPEERKYRKNILGIRNAYSNLLIQVEIGGRSIEDLGRDCAILAKVHKNCGAPSVFRIALIGSRGSGCHTVAKYLSQRYNIVHVDFNYIMEQSRLQETTLGETVRKYEHKWGRKPDSKIRIQIVEKRILERDCLRKGWVLTGYPITVDDFKLFDQLATPPNRVIFVDVDGHTVRERLVARRYNVVTGSEHNLASKNIAEIHVPSGPLGIHPKDYRSVIEEDIWEYEENVNELKKYAGESAQVIDGNAGEKIVREKIEACLIKAAPSALPRISQLPPEIKPSQIEFDPFDEPDPRVFDQIREPEPTFSFI